MGEIKKDINLKELKESIGADGIKLLLEYIRKQRKKK